MKYVVLPLELKKVNLLAVVLPVVLMYLLQMPEASQSILNEVSDDTCFEILDRNVS